MLYLAEVQKQSKGFMGGSETKLQLLACQRNDQTWSAVPKGESISTEEVASFNDGALVMVNLSENRQVQGKPEPAGSQLARILDRFSSVVEKSKKEEEKIEQWRESLNYQGQVLNERQEELDARFEELEQKETELKELDAKKEELQNIQAQAEQIKQEFELKSKELEGAWDHLRGEQKRLEERSEEVKASGSVLDGDSSLKLQDLLSGLSSSQMPSEGLGDKLKQVLAIIEEHQSVLQKEWGDLEAQNHNVQHIQSDLENRENELKNRKKELKDSLISLETAKTELRVQEKVLASKQQSVRLLDSNITSKEELRELLSQIAGGCDVSGDSKVDISALENMPLSQLQETVDNLRADLDRLVRFVNDQEEELTLQKQTIDELQEKSNSVSESEKINFEGELEDEREGYKMLNESLVGSRRNLLERQNIFKQHLLMLRRRQGIVDVDGTPEIDLNPLLEILNEQSQQEEEEKANLEDQIDQIHQSIQQMQNIIEQQQSQQKIKEEQMLLDETHLESDRIGLIKLQERMAIYENTLNPIKDSLGNVKEKIQEFEQISLQMEQVNHQQNETLKELEETLKPIL
jgi:DNA repair exonuclease SbcCD ATPase subunit